MGLGGEGQKGQCRRHPRRLPSAAEEISPGSIDVFRIFSAALVFFIHSDRLPGTLVSLSGRKTREEKLLLPNDKGNDLL